MSWRNLIPTPRAILTGRIENELRRPGRQNSVIRGLVPIGDSGLYVTPSTPADPTDCARYPDSPYCGGNPLSLRPIGLDAQILRTGCDFGVQINPVLGFVRLPPVAIAYRSPECRKKAKYAPPPAEGSLDIPFPNLDCPEPYTTSTVLYPYRTRFIEDYYFIDEDSGFELGVAPGQSYQEHTDTATLIDFQFPYKGDKHTTVGKTLSYLKFTVHRKYYANDKAVEVFNASWAKVHGTEPPSLNGESYFGVEILVPESYTNPGFGNYNFSLLNPENETDLKEGLVIQMPLDYARNLLVSRHNEIGVREILNIYKDIHRGYDSYERYYAIAAKCSLDIEPPPPPNRICCMPQCCTPPDNALLKSLIKKVNKLSEIIGVDEFPAQLPPTLINEDQGFLGNLIPDANVPIPNYAQLFKWWVERFDEIMGQWEVAFEVKDSDPTTPGDQPVGVKLPNLAEAVAEMMGLLLQSTINTETLVSMCMRSMLTTGQDYQQNYKSYMAIQSIIDYLGYKTKDSIEKMPLLFDPSKETLEGILQHVSQDVPVQEFDEKTNFRHTVMRLEHAAAITQAINLRKIDKKGDIAKQIADIIKAAAAIDDKVNGQEKDADGKTNFDKFLEDVEVGFTNYTGVTDSQHPYGEDYTVRPKIKKIGDQGAQL